MTTYTRKPHHVQTHLEEWRDSVQVGDTATVAQIVSFECAECKGEYPPAGAIAARLFPPASAGPCKIQGVVGVTDSTRKMARRTA